MVIFNKKVGGQNDVRLWLTKAIGIYSKAYEILPLHLKPEKEMSHSPV